MSVIRKVPFIKYLIDDLTAQQKTTLLDVINGEKSLVNASFDNMPNDAITPVLFKLNERDSKTGILILSSNYRVLIAYHRFQDLLMIKLNSDNTYEKVNEYLDINELRRLVEEADDHIVATEIDSGEATEGKVLAADGDGGAEWMDTLDTITPENVESGDAVQLFGFDAQGNLVKDDIPEGIVVDETIIEDSPNAVAGGAVYDALADVDTELETKANVDGNYPTMTVGVADQLSPYDEDSGDDQDEPFILQGTGTANGTQNDFSTGSIALMREKQGNTVVVNQLAPALNSTYWATLNGSATFSDGVATFTASAQSGILYGNSQFYKHTYLAFANVKLTTGNTNVYLRVQGVNRTPTINTTNWQMLFYVFTSTLENYSSIAIRDERTENWDAIQIKDVSLIDLTQWFNGDIPQDLLDNPSNFFRYYQGSLAYNAGTLVNANGRYVKCIGMNQWDEQWELGGIDPQNGQNAVSSESIRGKNYRICIPNKSYYFKGSSNGIIYWYDKDYNYISYEVGVNQQHTSPSNASYFRIAMSNAYGTTYRNDISINLYYEDEARCLTYEPYQVLTNNDTGTEILRKAGSVKDSKAPDGTITRRVASVDLSTLSWTQYSGNRYYSNNISELKINTKNIICNTLLLNKTATSATDLQPNEIAVFENRIYVNSATQTGTLFYELAEPTTEQGTPFSENLVIDDFGSMDFGGTNGVPQGNLIFYPVDYKAFIDTLYNYTQGTPSNIALKSDVSSEQSARESIDTQLQNAIGGTLRHQLVAQVVAGGGTLDFNNTAWIDLSTITFSFATLSSSGGGVFYASISGKENGTQNIIACNYALHNSSANTMPINSVLGNASSDVVYICVSQTSGTIKGTGLLAYEKASS